MPNDSSVPSTRRARLLIDDGQRAVARLADALAQPETEFVRDAAIQRFEFSFELAWKATQAVATLEGQDCPSPRTALSTAWRNGWLDDEAAWLEMLEDRNRTSHTYRDALAKDVFSRLSHHLPRLQQRLERLNARLNQIDGSAG